MATSIRANAVAAPIETLKPTDGKRTVTKSYCVITGASSGLGLATSMALAESGEWHVVMACRDFLKVVNDPSLSKSGVYWSWNNDSSSFENVLSEKASNQDKAKKVWEVSEKLVGLA
ncbi:hypothetical protein L7F22_021289 [Adiantum nelumboides]|nr:hypothetical protein [Adiantum nelumboides]